MNKLEQRLSDLTRQLSAARRDKNHELIEELEDEIAELEYDLEEEYSSKYAEADFD